MAWVQGHYVRRRRSGRSRRRYGRSPSVGTMVLIALGIVLLIYLFNR
jgi:hypothetical protein